ncbi:hypothetical protein [Paraclostridium bifermentans]|uniref:hypothetical protein n=1 Tax=Paraclostridium bifermentans TaxID=1490 RepID=UPI00359C148C
MFLNDTEILIRKSNKDLSILKLGNKIIYEDNKLNLKETLVEELIENQYSFVDVYLDIDTDDNIYGIINDKKGKIFKINIQEKKINKEVIFKYYYKDFHIKFPYIKKIQNKEHILYYSINKENPYTSYLMHIYNSDGVIIKNKVDYIQYNIMSNFEVLWDESLPILFYFKYINGCEELCVSIFNSYYNEWTKPFNITDSKKAKIYLNIIKDKHRNYHIVFSENHEGKYHCKYIKGKFENNKFEIYESKTIKTNLMCLFPHLINHDNEIYIEWGEYDYVYTCKSSDLGSTWSNPVLKNKESNISFRRYIFKSNYKEADKYICSTIFGSKDYENIIVSRTPYNKMN